MSSLVNWLFVDRNTGRIVIGQKPNLLMLVFIAATASRLIPPAGRDRHGRLASTVRVTQAGALLLWAVDEMLRGVNPFRRIGGMAVLAATPFRALLR